MKIFKNIAFCALLSSLPAAAQNTATQNGNWNDCATWGNPTSIIQNATDTKTINTGVTVTQNTAWSAGNLTLNGTGAVAFASAANSVDFVTDGGSDKSCCIPPTNVSGISSTSGNFIEFQTSTTFSCTATGAVTAQFLYTLDGTSGTFYLGAIVSGTTISANSGTYAISNTAQAHIFCRVYGNGGTCYTDSPVYDFTIETL